MAIAGDAPTLATASCEGSQVVCHVSTAHPTFDSRIFMRECRTLAKAGYEVHLVIPGERDEVVDGVTIHALPKASGKLDRATSQVRRAIALARKTNATLFHFHDAELWPAAILLQRQGAKTIMDVHEDFPNQVRQRAPGPLKSGGAIAFDRLERMAAAGVSGIVTADEKQAKRFSQYNDHVVCANNYPELVDYDTYRQKHGSKRELILSMGGFFVERCGPTIASANAGILVGGGAKAEALGAHPEFDGYIGRLNADEVQDHYARMKIGIVMFSDQPNHQQIRSNRLFENMNAGVPVIVSDLREWRAFIDEHQCGIYVPPEDANALAEAVRHLLANPQKAEQMGRNALEAVKRQFNWGVEQTGLLELYGRLLS